MFLAGTIARLRAMCFSRSASKRRGATALAWSVVVAAAAAVAVSGWHNAIIEEEPLDLPPGGESAPATAGTMTIGREFVNASAIGLATRTFELNLTERSLANGMHLEVSDLGAGEDCLFQIHVRNSTDLVIRSTLARPSCACADFRASRDLPSGGEADWQVRITRSSAAPMATAGIQIPYGEGAATLLALRCSERASRQLIAWIVASSDVVPAQPEHPTGSRVCAIAASDSGEAPLPIGWIESESRAEPLQLSPPRLIRSGAQCGDWLWYFDGQLPAAAENVGTMVVIEPPGWRRARVTAAIHGMNTLFEADEPAKAR